MKFKNYCLIVLGKVDGVKDEISKISESAVRYVDAKGIVMATFSTVVTVAELREFFILHDRSFVLFEMGDDNYGVNLANKALHEHLFGEIETNGPEVLDSLTNKLIADIQRTGGNIGVHETVISGASKTEVSKPKMADFKDIDINALSISEKENIVNTILDKGVENMSSYDKKLLSKLTKNAKK